MYYNDRVTFGLKRSVANGLIWLFSPLSAIIFYFGTGSDKKTKHKAMQAIIIGVTIFAISRLTGVMHHLPVFGGIFRYAMLKIVSIGKLSMFVIAILEFCKVDINIPVVSKLAMGFIE